MKVDVCGLDYELKVLDSNSRVDDFMGRSDPKLNLITINKDMPNIDVPFTMCHELSHISHVMREDEVVYEQTREELNKIRDQLIEQLINYIKQIDENINTTIDYYAAMEDEHKRQAARAVDFKKQD